MDWKSGSVIPTNKKKNPLAIIAKNKNSNVFTFKVVLSFQNVRRNEVESPRIFERMFSFGQIAVKEATKGEDVGRNVAPLMI